MNGSNSFYDGSIHNQSNYDNNLPSLHKKVNSIGNFGVKSNQK